VLRDLGQVRSLLGGSPVFALFDAPWVPIYLGVIFLLHPLVGTVAMGGAVVLFGLALTNELVTREPLRAANRASVRRDALRNQYFALEAEKARLLAERDGAERIDFPRALEEEILGGGRIGAEDVLKLRRAIYSNGDINRNEAAFLFHLNRASDDNDPAWAEFYVEALSDFFYWREGTESSLSADAEQILLDAIGEDGDVDDPTELRLLLNLLFRTNGASERFRAIVFDAVRHSVLHSDHALHGHAERTPGVIDRADVEVIRKLVYGRGGANGMAIGRAEAEFLFDLDNATSSARNDPAWRDLFVKAITMYLLFAGPSPEQVCEAEATWLLEHIDADRHDRDNERALLAYLRQEAQALHPALEPSTSASACRGGHRPLTRSGKNQRKRRGGCPGADFGLRMRSGQPVFSMFQATNNSALGTPFKVLRHATGVTNWPVLM